jgi:nucleotide-binding universal stress UspA family protein
MTMDFRDILIHIDATSQCDQRVELALSLAQQHDALLTGIFVLTEPHYAPQYESRKMQARAIEERFRKAAGEAAVAVDWIVADWWGADVGMAGILSYYAHTRDLLVISQSANELHREGPPATLPEQVLVGSGRPVLIVPYAGKFTTVGNCSIVAWRGGRASARAVNDALPLLMKSQKIYALSIKTPGESLLYQTAGCDICAYLIRRGLSCVGEEISAAEIPVANVLMNFAWDKGCDLLVAGVYVQKSGKKLVLGPVGRQLLKDMTLPILMSY